ncbi:phosphomannomutase CpsG [Endozoicomonas sp. 8E]|uniref:phosphomannomutase CpsG n=1 Tax=Endozoicomonas sp. 8E TaxID=3035692 RepID=UPI00293907B6|nr:phosphomannomutase CpsG [Endozoicomonas sp. 8E]WOG25827.1 phosphomannomutase CpsG [Endozoicomonas sp. 8E]
MDELTCFKAYDIRGQLGSELNNEVAYRIGRAFGEYLNAKKVALGGDARETSEELKVALARGLQDAGSDVLDLGLTGTEEVYFAAQYLDIDGAIEVTASHNPIDYNGMKLVREHAKPISGDTGLFEIKKLVETGNWKFENRSQIGTFTKVSILDAYIEKILSFINLNNLSLLKLVINSGNGAAGHVIDAIESKFISANIPVELIKVHNEPDSTFPNGIANPLLPECRQDTIDAVKAHDADMGIAFDGDFDRCFFFDENGKFIEGYYIVGLLAEAFLDQEKGAKIIHDPRLIWNTLEVVKNLGGTPIVSKTGHAFIKERMRSEDAIYGGEMSAHHYFRDFAYCDSGMIPWLLVAELMCRKKMKLSEMVKERIAAYPSSGEINSKLENPNSAIKKVLSAYQQDALSIGHTDGVSLEFQDWRFNLRCSNTEPVVRLNVESKKDEVLMSEKTKDILGLLRS